MPKRASGPLSRRVLVTGGAHRLGALICQQFAQDGWQVWCHAQNSAAAAQALCQHITSQGGHAQVVQADLASGADRQRMMAQIEAQGGPLDCLVNNASSFEPDGARDFDENAMRAQLEVNLIAPLALSRLMAQSLVASEACADSGNSVLSGARSIIHVLDQKVLNLNPDYFSYTVSKLALERSVALQAQALAPQIRVCGVAPGLMFISGPQTQANFDQASQMNLLQRAIDPAQVAATCLFLANNPALNGVTLAVDNGQHLVPLSRDVMFVVDGAAKEPHA
jgi:NAD(P)-dependent dehydrogenase (short-subunit alcohol dehydrogenase family)